MYNEKEVRVILSKDADEVYNELNKIVGEEIRKGINSSIHQSLLRSIKRLTALLKENPFAGNQIFKKSIPKSYIKKYGIDNLWRMELLNRWRLMYTITFRLMRSFVSVSEQNLGERSATSEPHKPC